MKLLVIRLSSIGDIVMTTPLIRCLKLQMEGSDIHYLTGASYQEVLRGNPHLTAIHAWKENDGTMGERLKAEDFDLVIDLQNDPVSRKMVDFLRKPFLRYDELPIRKKILTTLKWNLMPAGEHVVDRYMKTVASLGVRHDGLGLEHFIPKGEEISERDIPASHQLGYIAITAGASRFTKILPVAQMQELCRRIDHPIILLGDQMDVDRAFAISGVDPIKIYNACGKFSLHETADLIRRAKFLIAHDTGLMHIGTALRKPVISIWGSTVPSLGMTPYYGKKAEGPESMYDTVQVRKLWCRPCTDVGRDHCPLGHFKCMRRLSIDELLQRVAERLR